MASYIHGTSRKAGTFERKNNCKEREGRMLEEV